MFKTLAFACAALALASAQSLQDLANTATAAADPVASQAIPLVQHGDSVSLNINNYEWTLTEAESGEFSLSVNQLAASANNLAPTLAALLANVGNAGQDNNEAAAGILDAEAANNGVSIENSAGLAEVAGQYSAQLTDASGAAGGLADSQYNAAAAALASNANGITDQVNSQLNAALQNQESLNAAVNNAVNLAVANAGTGVNAANSQTGNLPVPVQQNVNPLTTQAANAALNNAGSVDANDAAASANGLANQALGAGVDAANNNLPSGLSNAVQGAASDASSSAATSLGSAATALNNNNAGTVQAAANLANP